MSGVKGRSGRPRTPGRITKQAHDWLQTRIPLYYEELDKRALNGDKDCLIYLCDRLLGRPHQSIDQRVKGALAVFSAEDYLTAVRPLLSQFLAQQLPDNQDTKMLPLPGNDNNDEQC